MEFQWLGARKAKTARSAAPNLAETCRAHTKSVSHVTPVSSFCNRSGSGQARIRIPRTLSRPMAYAPIRRNRMLRDEASVSCFMTSDELAYICVRSRNDICRRSTGRYTIFVFQGPRSIVSQFELSSSPCRKSASNSLAEIRRTRRCNFLSCFRSLGSTPF